MKKPYYFVKIAEGQEREIEIIKNKVRLIEKKRNKCNFYYILDPEGS